VKYLKALLNEEEISSHPREQEPIKPTKPVLSVLSGDESKKPRQASEPSQLRELYHQTAESIAEECFSLPLAWLLDHMDFYERIRDLDGKLSAMEREGVGTLEYQATLARLLTCVQDARALFERERDQAGEGALQ
jgi:hypothetical protein